MILKSKAIACCHSHSQMKKTYLIFPQTPCLLQDEIQMSLYDMHEPPTSGSSLFPALLSCQHLFTPSLFSCHIQQEQCSKEPFSHCILGLMSISNQHSLHTSPTRQNQTLLSKHSSNILFLQKTSTGSPPHHPLYHSLHPPSSVNESAFSLHLLCTRHNSKTCFHKLTQLIFTMTPWGRY